MLDVQNLSKSFQPGTPSEQKGLDGVTLHLEPGEFVSIIGSNGAGKSTLFNALAGTFLPDSGRITLDGQDITFEKEHKRARDIGRLFQDPRTGTAPGLTVEENLALVYSKASGRFALRKALTKKDREYFRDLLSKLEMGLENRLYAKVGLLSGGQRQALTLLTATMVPPKLLLLDEHTAALDPVTAGRVMDLTTAITSASSITTLMITHNIASALKTGTRTIMMDSGKIVMDIAGRDRETMTPSTLLEHYRQILNHDLDNDRMLLSDA